MTSRTLPEIDIDAVHGEILPLDDSQIQELRKRYEIEFSPEINNNPLDYMRNPLIFRLAAEIYGSKKTLSTEDFVPIKKYLENFLRVAWEKEEGDITPSIKYAILSRIALKSHFSQRFTLSDSEAMEIVRSSLLEYLGNKAAHYSEIGIIDYFMDQNILARYGSDEIGFAHRLLEEHFYEIGVKREQLKKGRPVKPTVLRNSFAEFEKMIDIADLQERDYQKFLERNAWLFGGEYVKAYPQKRAGSELIEDFLLEKYDGFHDVVEIKRPHHKLFVAAGNALSLSSECTRGISRLMDYLDYYERNVQEEYWKSGKQIYKPKGIVVIGRDENTDKRKLRQLNSHLTSIEIWTYDDLLMKARKILELIEKDTDIEGTR